MIEGSGVLQSNIFKIIMGVVSIFPVIHKKVGPVLSAWRVKQSVWRYPKLNTRRWTLARPFRIKFEDESRHISPFPFSFLIVFWKHLFGREFSHLVTRGR